MEKSIKQKTNQRTILLDLPIKKSSLLSHLSNIEHCIEQIKNYSGSSNNLVVGYNIMRSTMGTKEILHKILPKEKAEVLKKDNRNFDYFTLDDLLEEKKAYKEGKYKVNEDGYFVGLNPSYAKA